MKIQAMSIVITSQNIRYLGFNLENLKYITFYFLFTLQLKLMGRNVPWNFDTNN